MTRIVLAAVVAALALPATAGAHLKTGTVAVDDRTFVTSGAHSSAFAIAIYQSDRAVHLTVARGHTLYVLDAGGERFLRLDDTGVVFDGQRLSRGHSYTWHDVALRPRVSSGITRWTIPLVVDGTRITVHGETVSLPKPAHWPWILVALLFPVLLLLRPARSATRLGSLAGIAGAVLAVAFALDRYASPGTWIAGADEIAFLAAGFGVLCYGPRQARAAAAAGLGLVAVAIAASKGAVFLHPVVLSVLPSTVARGAAAIALGAGAAAAVIGVRSYVAASSAAPTKSSARYRSE